VTSFGFYFRYRMSGLPPSTQRFAGWGEQGLVPGDMVRLDAGVPVLTATLDFCLLGCVIEPRADWETDIEVIADEDAVYGVADPHARDAGTNLDLAGGSGAQTVQESVNDDFEVVADSTAEEETLLRITLGRHCDFIAAVPVGEAAATWTALTPARERQLVMAAAAGDSDACAELVEAFLPAIASVARRYRGAETVERTELLQEGVVGLLRAMRRFDPSLGNPFWAYARWWVRQAMQQLISELTRPTVLSDRAQRGLARIREARRTHVQAHGREPSRNELAALVGLPRDLVESLLAAERAQQPLHVIEDDRQSRTGEDALADPVAEEEFDRILSRLEIERIRDLTKALTAREREILYQHYGLDGPPKTLRAIGEALGISHERVRQIEEQTLDKLRAATLGPPAHARSLEDP
jgi:RNA polymerase sigma factor (sigma-70 family)